MVDLATGLAAGVANFFVWELGKRTVLSPNSIATAMLIPERISERTQRGYFKEFKREVKVKKVEIYVPRFETREAGVRAVFVEPGALHIVFNDEVFPLDEDIDEKYRKMRRRVFGRTADVESLEVSITVVEHATFPLTSALPNPVYESSVHGYDIQPWTGRIFKNTWNGLLSTFPNPGIVAKGGYVKAGFELRKGDRREAERYAQSIN